MKKLMLGNEAIARGAYEAGVKVSSAYPGTPSTEISEYMVQYKDSFYCEWAPNEKVALEVAIGSAISGERAMASMKHVGLNVASDPLFTVAYSGINAGLVVNVADDPGLYSSQNEQDTRMVGRSANVPVIEPSDSAEAKDFVKYAFDISEKYDTPVILRLTTRLSHSQGLVELSDRVEHDKDYEKNVAKYVMMPNFAKLRHLVVEERMKKLSEDASDMPYLNTVEYKDKKVGIITNGIAYQYVKEACPNYSVLKLGLTHPLPKKLITEFAKNVDELIIFEELEPVIEEQVKSWGIKAKGKELFTIQGEYSANMLKSYFEGFTYEKSEIAKNIPNRPPVLCPGCPHRSVYTALNQLKMHSAGDIGCYTLGAVPPLSVIDTTVCMGASISTLHGIQKAKGREFVKDWVAVIGDSTFLHTGINSLIGMVYNKGVGTVMILDNSTTGMTGHQEHASTGKTLQGDVTNMINLKELCHSVGVKYVDEVSAFDLAGIKKLLKDAKERDTVSVIITKAPCILLKSNNFTTKCVVDSDKCRKCGACLKPGCPALTKCVDGKVTIESTMCNGCGLCKDLCKFGAISEVNC